jgi:hypothetical protein
MSGTGGRNVRRKPLCEVQLRAVGVAYQGRCLQGGDAEP